MRRAIILTGVVLALIVSGCGKEATSYEDPLYNLTTEELIDIALSEKTDEKKTAAEILEGRNRTWIVLMERLDSIMEDSYDEKDVVAILDMLDRFEKPADDDKGHVLVKVAFQSPSFEVREQAAWLLEKKYDEWEGLLEDLLEEDGDASWRAAALLAREDNENGEAYIIRKLGSKTADDKVRALTTIEENQLEKLSEYAASLLNDDSSRVRAKSARVVGIFGDKEEGTLLYPLINDSSSEVRGQAALSIATLARKDSVDFLNDALVRETDPEAKTLISQAIIIASER